MTTTKAVLLTLLFTGMSAAIGVSTGVYVGYRKAQEKLNVDGGTLLQTASTFGNFDETLRTIAAAPDSDFGKRAAALRASHPFTPPADGRLTEHQIDQFLAVKRKLMDIDDEMAADFQRDNNGGQPSTGNLLKWNFFSRTQRLRMAQIDALETQQMTFEEYNWVHFRIYQALVALGVKPEDLKQDWAAEVQKAVDQSSSDIERQLDDPSTPETRKRDLRDLQKSLADGRQTLTDSAHSLQTTLASVPDENKQLVREHQDALAKALLAAVELETLDIMRALESGKVS